MGKDQLTNELYEKIKKSTWDLLVKVDESLKNTNLDDYLKDIENTFNTQFPSIKAMYDEEIVNGADGDIDIIKDDENTFAGYQLMEALKMLSSHNTFQEYQENDSFSDDFDAITVLKYAEGYAINQNTSNTEIAKAYIIVGMCASINYYLGRDNELTDYLYESVEDYIHTQVKEKYLNVVFDKKKEDYTNEALSNFNEAIKINAFNVGYTEEELSSLGLKAETLDERSAIIEKLKALNISTEALDDPYYSILDEETLALKATNKPTQEQLDEIYNTQKTKFETLALPKMPESKSPEEIKSLQDKRANEKRIAAEKAAAEQKRQEEIEANFKPYDDEAKYEKAVNEGLEQYARDNSDPENESDRFRFDDKKRIETLSKLYSLWFPGDKDMKPLLDKLQFLSTMNVSAYDGYRQEVKVLDEIERLANQCRENIEQQNEILHAKSIATLKVFTDKNGNKNSWPTKEDLDKNPKLKAVDEAFGEMQQLIDRKLSAVESISQFIKLRKNGELDYFEIGDAHHIQVNTSDIERPSKNTDAANANNSISIKQGKYFDAKDFPLFPHQPSPDDARQGAIGDCYFVSTLSDIARHRPEKIREAMVENDDGTVTVRLFGKRKNEQTQEVEYYPVYVTVDKVIPIADSGQAQMAENCVWINCFEKAVAASGLVSSERFDSKNGILRPAPENPAELNEKYKELKKLEDEGRLDSNTINKYTKDYPWLFTVHEGVTRLIKYPSLNSIVGGTGIVATELLLGPEITRTQASLEAYDDGAIVRANRRDKYINLNPKNPMQMCAIILANKNGALIADDFDVPCPLDLNLPKDKLFDAAFKLSKLPAASRAEAEKEFNDNIKELSDYVHEYRDTLSKEDLINASRNLFDAKTGGNLRVHTLNPLKEKPYNQAQIDLYNNIEKTLKKHLPVSCASNPNATKIPGNHQYSIIGVYTDEVGRRMLKLKNPWGTWQNNGVKTTFNLDGTRSYEKIEAFKGEFEMELKDAMQEMTYVEYSQAKDVPEYTSPKKIEGDIINLNSNLSYTEALDNICQQYKSTERWYGGDSAKFKLLKKDVNAVRNKLPLIKTKKELVETLDGLSQRIKDYEDHCKAKVVNDGRRNTKVRATNDLKDVIEAAKQAYISPRQYKKELGIKNLDENIKALNKDIKEAVVKCDGKLLIEKVSEKIYYTKLLKDADNMPYNKFEKAITAESCHAACQSNKALVVHELANIDGMFVKNWADDGTLDKKIVENLQKDFRSEKSILDAKNMLKSNESKLNKHLAEFFKKPVASQDGGKTI